MRKPIVAGQFYSADKTNLDKEIESSFRHRLGPGMPKVPLKEKRIFGIIVPHAGYVYSGSCASHAYKELAELNKKSFPDTFILLGPNHSGYGKAFFSLTFEDFETPLGIIKNHTELGTKIMEQTSHLGLQEDKQAHNYEHSLEVQLPFLQFVSKIAKKEIKIIPIIISTQEYSKLVAVGRKIGEICKEKNVCVIASSDFTHYGQNYGFIPFPASEAKTRLKDLDRKSINHILKLESKAFYEEATKTTICGTGAIVVAIEACKKMGSKKASLLKYYTSGDIAKNYSNAVGYASFIFD
ncbi:MAG: AmmeMemoRadiSam system protein B [Candidatus Pacearchaeota archaeon]|nr:MAG: AmmeMemoRadiSam system protein B [Candidatus Pacearchaeota archaeon]